MAGKTLALQGAYPNRDIVVDGARYRTDSTGIVHAEIQHERELRNRGYTTVLRVPVQDIPTVADPPVPAPILEEVLTESPPTAPAPMAATLADKAAAKEAARARARAKAVEYTREWRRQRAAQGLPRKVVQGG